MMTLVRRFAGLLALLVGLVGMAFAVVTIYQTWIIQRSLDAEVPAAFNKAHAIVQSVHQQGQTTSELLNTTRQHLASLSVPIQELASRNQRLNSADILGTLDETILRRMENIEHFSLSMQNSMRSMSNALLILDSLHFLNLGNPQNKNPNQWKDLAGSLSKSADLLEEASQSVSRIRSGQDVPPQQMEQLANVLSQIDEHLQRVQVNIQHFSQTVEQTDSALNSAERVAPEWILRVAIVITVFFTCFCFSQISLIVHGWQLLK